MIVIFLISDYSPSRILAILGGFLVVSNENSRRFSLISQQKLR